MRDLNSAIFKPLPLKRCVLPSRLIRSATYEGMADAQGYPQKSLTDLYLNLASAEPLTIITGFTAVSRQGRAMHAHQGAIWDDSYIEPWRKVAESVKAASPQTRLFMQLAHTGRQTLKAVTGQAVVGASSRRCTYFRQQVRGLNEAEIEFIIDEFAVAAGRAQAAGFDGVQVHAAHGYLIHQFLSPYTNTRTDRWRDGDLLLMKIIKAVRNACGPAFPILMKISHGDDRGFKTKTIIDALKKVEDELDAVEVSYGTMEYALNIIRGALPLNELLKINPLFKNIPGPLKFLWKCCVYPFKKAEFKTFSYGYNLDGALAIKSELKIPLIPVGGLHRLEDIDNCLIKHNFAAVALCRPFICEPNLAAKIKAETWQGSLCTRCNQCTINCDSFSPLFCRLNRSHYE